MQVETIESLREKLSDSTLPDEERIESRIKLQELAMNIPIICLEQTDIFRCPICNTEFGKHNIQDEMFDFECKNYEQNETFELECENYEQTIDHFFSFFNFYNNFLNGFIVLNSGEEEKHCWVYRLDFIRCSFYTFGYEKDVFSSATLTLKQFFEYVTRCEQSLILAD